MPSEDPDRRSLPPDRPEHVTTDSGPVQLGPGSEIAIDLAPPSHHHHQASRSTPLHHHHHHHHHHIHQLPDPLSQRLLPRPNGQNRPGMSEGPPDPNPDLTPARQLGVHLELPDDIPTLTPTRLPAELAAIHLGRGSGSSTPDPAVEGADGSGPVIERADMPIPTAIALARLYGFPSASRRAVDQLEAASGGRSRPDGRPTQPGEISRSIASGLNPIPTPDIDGRQDLPSPQLPEFMRTPAYVQAASQPAGQSGTTLGPASSQGLAPASRLMFGDVPSGSPIPFPPGTTTTSTTRTTITRISADGEVTEHPYVFTEGNQADEAVRRIEAAHREAYDLLLNRIRDRSAAEAVERSSGPGGDDVEVEDMDEDEDGMEDDDDEDEEEDEDEDHEDDDDETAHDHDHEHEERQDLATSMPVMPEGLIEVWGPPAPGSDAQTRFTLFLPTIVGGNPQMRIVQPTIISVDGQDGANLDREPNINALAGPSTHLDPGRGLGRSKSVKRRRLDPSAKNATTWLPSFMTHPISRVPTSELPEYMRFSNLPIRAVPTSLNAADCAARLLLTPGLATPSPNTPPQEPLLAVCYVGTGERGDPDASAVRANHPIPSTCGVYYYEVEIASKGRDGYISIGFCSRWTDLNRLVGWERESWAWHMDDGFIFESRGEGINRKWPTSTTGDIIGCGIDFTTGRAFFTKNSRFIGEAFGSLQDKGRLYPAVGLRTPGEKLLVNFTGPFKYDIVSHVRGTRDRVQAEVQASPMYMYLHQPAEPAETSGTDGDVDMQAPGATGGTSTPTSTQDQKSTLSKSRMDLVHSTLADQVHTCDNCTEPPVTRRRAIRDVDTSLTSSVLEYLKGGGHFEAAKGMERVLQRRAADEANMDGSSRVDQDMDQDEDEKRPAEASEEEQVFEHLRKCRDQYIRGDVFEVVSSLLPVASASSSRPITAPEFLTNYKNGIWQFRLRLQYFYRLLRGDLLSSDELNPDYPAFRFFYGPDHAKGFSQGDRLGRLLAAGRYLQSEHSGSTDEEVVKGLDVFALMAYEDVKEAPEELTKKMGEGVRRVEAGKLFVDLRVYHGQPATSRIERAYRQTSHTLLELGVLHGSAKAAFLEMPR